MDLTAAERDMLEGREGPARQRAMKGLVQLGRAYGAPRLVEIGYAHIHAGMALYLGLIHERDGVAGTLRRYRTAKRHCSDFGLSTECGFGRYQPHEAAAILDAHTQVMGALEDAGAAR